MMVLLPFAAAVMTTAAPPMESATLPLPTDLRASATIVTFDKTGKQITLRAGTGNMVCNTDFPGDDVFDVRCYHRDFVPYIHRSWTLAAQGMAEKSIEETIRNEIASGTFHMRMAPSAGYRMYGPKTALIDNGTAWTSKMARWQSIHIPRATAEDMGLTTVYEGQMPYVMSSGDLWSHIMINSPPDDK